MSPGLAPLSSKQALADRAHEAIRRAILSLELPPGTQLTERQLAEQLGISKTPVRAALVRLLDEGLVSQATYLGAVVRTFEPDYVMELYAVREVLERMAVELAVPRLSARDLRGMKHSLDMAERSIAKGDRITLAEANSEFHGAFVKRCQNRPLEAFLGRMHDKVRVIAALNWDWRRESMSEAHRQHCEILEAAVAGEASRAANLASEHVRNFRQDYARIYRSDQSSSSNERTERIRPALPGVT